VLCPLGYKSFASFKISYPCGLPVRGKEYGLDLRNVKMKVNAVYNLRSLAIYKVILNVETTKIVVFPGMLQRPAFDFC
jgi:hypothetical protein